MKNISRVVLLFAVVALGVWLWRSFFPSPETVIRRQFQKLAEAISVRPNEGLLRRAVDLQRLEKFFAPSVEVNIDLPGHHQQMLMSRDDIVQGATAVKWTGGLTVTFPDVNVTVRPDNMTAVADVTVQASTPENPDLVVQEMRFALQKIDGKWQITRVETVRTLSMRTREKVMI